MFNFFRPIAPPSTWDRGERTSIAEARKPKKKTSPDKKEHRSIPIQDLDTLPTPLPPRSPQDASPRADQHIDSSQKFQTNSGLTKDVIRAPTMAKGAEDIRSSGRWRRSYQAEGGSGKPLKIIETLPMFDTPSKRPACRGGSTVSEAIDALLLEADVEQLPSLQRLKQREKQPRVISARPKVTAQRGRATLSPPGPRRKPATSNVQARSKLQQHGSPLQSSQRGVALPTVAAARTETSSPRLNQPSSHRETASTIRSDAQSGNSCSGSSQNNQHGHDHALFHDVDESAEQTSSMTAMLDLVNGSPRSADAMEKYTTLNAVYDASEMMHEVMVEGPGVAKSPDHNDPLHFPSPTESLGAPPRSAMLAAESGEDIRVDRSVHLEAGLDVVPPDDEATVTPIARQIEEGTEPPTISVSLPAPVIMPDPLLISLLTVSTLEPLEESQQSPIERTTEPGATAVPQFNPTMPLAPDEDEIQSASAQRTIDILMEGGGSIPMLAESGFNRLVALCSFEGERYSRGTDSAITTLSALGFDGITVLMSTHPLAEGLQAAGCCLISRLADTEHRKQQAVDANSFATLRDAFENHNKSATVVRWAVVALLRLIHGSVLRSEQAMDAQLYPILKSIVHGQHLLKKDKSRVNLAVEWLDMTSELLMGANQYVHFSNSMTGPPMPRPGVAMAHIRRGEAIRDQEERANPGAPYSSSTERVTLPRWLCCIFPAGSP